MLRRAGSGRRDVLSKSGKTKMAYFDCFSGISGDMCLGALVDAGVPLEKISAALKRLPVRGYALSEKNVLRAGIAATKVDVVLTKNAASKKAVRWNDVRKTILSSSLQDDIREKGLAVFRLLFEAEATVHGRTLKNVHLHELGGIDCLIDVFGTLIGLDLLGVREVYASPLNLGGGFVSTGHGTLPVPAPATAQILKDIPVYPSATRQELTTPTGAALIKHLARGFGNVPAFIPEAIGAGAGSRDLDRNPNILRLFIGYAEGEKLSGEAVTIIQTNIDDMNPQTYEYVAERLFEQGALDVFLTQTVMKKMRPAACLTVLCDRADRNDLITLILRETTTIGVRYYEAERVIMKRRLQEVKTRYGTVRVKLSSAGDIRRVMPEYEDCRLAARKSGVPLLEVVEAAKREAAGSKGRRE